MKDPELCYLSATHALAHFRAGVLSPVELVEAVIARSESVNPKLNAYTYTFYERALQMAKRAENKYANRRRVGALEGVPVVIKDDHGVKGEITTHGSKLFEHNRDTKSSLTVDRLLKAGAVLLARTTTPEFAGASICASPLWGVTRNPWNLEYNSGGSSGGAGAAIAAGMATLADGADYAGSVRIPASSCGVFGYKPPTGRNPAAPPWNLNRFTVFGPLTRTVADGALMQNIMSGPHPEDLTSLKPKLSIPKDLKPIKGWKVALSTDLGFFAVDPEVERSVRKAAEVFRAMGCEVNEVALEWSERALDAFVAYARAFDLDPIENMPEAHQALLADYTRRLSPRIQAGFDTTYAQGAKVRAQMYESLGPVLKKHTVLLCPTLAVPGVGAAHSPVDGPLHINGIPIDPAIGWCLTYPFNCLSQLPAATVPAGWSASDVPIGLQIVGRPFDDVSVFRAAAAFEHAQPWSHRRPLI